MKEDTTQAAQPAALANLAFEGKPVRVVMENGEPWWVAADVCEVLGIDKHRDAVSRLDEDERGSVLVDTLGGRQEVASINEAGLYTLILRSRKPQAKAFKRWVTHEVLPTIRKTGIYMAPAPDESPTMAGVMDLVREFTYLKDEVAELRQDRNLAVLEAQALPEPLGVLPGMTNADHIKGAASIFSRLTGAPMSAVWPMLWREFELRFKVRVTVRKKKAGWKGSTLAYAVHAGYGEKIYSVLADMVRRHVQR